MWVFLNNAMLSVVAHRSKPEKVMVRARFREDLKRVFPGTPVVDTPTADYRFRTTVTRARLQEVLAAAVEGLAYPNFKGSVREPDRLRTYHQVWDVMERAQEARFRPAVEPVDFGGLVRLDSGFLDEDSAWGRALDEAEA